MLTCKLTAAGDLRILRRVPGLQNRAHLRYTPSRIRARVCLTFFGSLPTTSS